MGFFTWLFGKKNIQNESREGDPSVIERTEVDFHDEAERKRYIEGCLEQIGEAEKEINQLSGEYTLVTAYLKDMEEIETLPAEQSEELKRVAGKLQVLEKERRRFLSKKERMTESEYRKIRSQEDEVEGSLSKLREAEKYQKLVKQDLNRLDGERHAYGYRKAELKTGLVNLKGMAVICLTALAACILMLLILQLGFSLNTMIGYYVSVAAAAVAITVLYLRYMETDKELIKVEKAENRLIQLQNKVKIRYVNNVNLLDYLYLKYNVESADQLQRLWKLYQTEKEERRQLAEAEAGLDYHKKQLVEILSRYRVQDPTRWVTQPDAILDNKEMIEIRHEMILRRQALRKQMDYNTEIAETAQREVRDVVKKYPKYAAEITAMVEEAEKNFH